jgi:hypothetical protein
MGATGPGRGGHAIFPDYQTGRSALRSLLQSPSYAGKSLAEISRKYAEGPQGGEHWARGVAKYAGVDPSHVPVPKQDGGRVTDQPVTQAQQAPPAQPTTPAQAPPAQPTTPTGPGAQQAIPAGYGAFLGAQQPHAYARRQGEAGEFNAAATGEFGPAGAGMTTVELKNGQKVTVKAAVADRFKGFLNEMIDRGYPVDVRGGGGFVMRGKAGGGGLSMHAYGTAVDINVGKNPFVGRSGAGTTDMPEDEVERAAWKHGLSWGGRFGDPMHFEAMSAGAWASKQKQLAAGQYPTSPTAAASKAGPPTITGGVPFLSPGMPGMPGTPAVPEAARPPPMTVLDTAPLDRASSQRVDVNGTGKISVDVRAPPMTKVAAEGDGLFKKTEVARQTQMQLAQEGPSVGEE